MAGDKPLDGKEAAFELDPNCQQWQAGKRVNDPQRFLYGWRKV
jgi:hypothetical protein